MIYLVRSKGLMYRYSGGGEILRRANAIANGGRYHIPVCEITWSNKPIEYALARGIGLDSVICQNTELLIYSDRRNRFCGFYKGEETLIICSYDNKNVCIVSTAYAHETNTNT